MHSLARSNADPIYFLTLTYGKSWPSMSEAKEDLRVWSQRFRRLAARQGVSLCLVWRVERQVRGAPHFHLLIWCSGSPRESLVDGLQPTCRKLAGSMLASRRWRRGGLQRVRTGSWWDWLLTASALWSERLSSDGRASRAVLDRAVDCKRIRGRGDVVSYVSKYIGKVTTPADRERDSAHGAAEGRVWGTHGDRRLMEQNSLACLAAGDTEYLSGDLAESFEAEGVEWAAACERDTVLRYLAYHPPEKLWPLVDRWLRVFAGEPPVPWLSPWGIFPRLTRAH